MSPSKARFIARHTCWYKAARTIEEAAAVLAERLHAGAEHALVYRCPLSWPSEVPHFHMSSGVPAFPPRQMDEVIGVLGRDAYRQAGWVRERW